MKYGYFGIGGLRFLFAGIAIFACPAYAQYEVAEIPFFNTPKGTAALGGGLRLGQDLYIATDNEDQRQFDLVPLYLYNGNYVFFRGTAGGIHLFSNDNIEFNLMGRYRFTKLDPDRNAYFGDLHVHTEYSFDAYSFGTTATPAARS